MLFTRLSCDLSHGGMNIAYSGITDGSGLDEGTKGVSVASDGSGKNRQPHISQMHTLARTHTDQTDCSKIENGVTIDVGHHDTTVTGITPLAMKDDVGQKEGGKCLDTNCIQSNRISNTLWFYTHFKSHSTAV